MAEACPKMYSCSTNSSGWLNGTHPTVAEGIVQRKVCFLQLVSPFFKDCCYHSKNISVRNCGAFYVYRLDPPDYYSRYCGNGLPQAPGKNELSTLSLSFCRAWHVRKYCDKQMCSCPSCAKRYYGRQRLGPDTCSMTYFSASARYSLKKSLEYPCFKQCVSKEQLWITFFGDKQPYKGKNIEVQMRFLWFFFFICVVSKRLGWINFGGSWSQRILYKSKGENCPLAIIPLWIFSRMFKLHILKRVHQSCDIQPQSFWWLRWRHKTAWLVPFWWRDWNSNGWYLC